MAERGALCLEAPAGVDVGVGVGDLGVVRARELDLPLRCGHFLAARALVLQGPRLGGVTEGRERGQCEEKAKEEGERENRQQGEKLNQLSYVYRATKFI